MLIFQSILTDKNRMPKYLSLFSIFEAVGDTPYLWVFSNWRYIFLASGIGFYTIRFQMLMAAVLFNIYHYLEVRRRIEYSSDG